MLTRRRFAGLSAGWLAGAALGADAVQWRANYDEDRVPRYTLPPLLTLDNGQKVNDKTSWRVRRAELLDAFSQHVYGRTPATRPAQRVDVHEAGVLTLDGRARRTQLSVSWPGHPDVQPVDVLLYAPAAPTAPVPVFCGLNFFGNHAVHADPGIRLSTRWMRSSDQHAVRDHRATEHSRGTVASRWPLEAIVEAGCAVMTAYCGDLAPDDPSVVGTGIAPLFADAVAAVPPEERWGALGMWAWGLSRMRDLVDELDLLDPTRVAVLGHSRLGKAALWAGAQDERVALVISNDSGCGGAALSRRAYGETVERITAAFPHWFCPRFATYAGREQALPVDQHQLLALAAPRALYVASAIEDRWADPKGEFLAAATLDPVYRLFGLRGLGTRSMPPVDRPIGHAVRYHVRTGGHDLTMYDWQQYLRAMRDLRGQP